MKRAGLKRCSKCIFGWKGTFHSPLRFVLYARSVTQVPFSDPCETFTQCQIAYLPLQNTTFLLRGPRALAAKPLLHSISELVILFIRVIWAGREIFQSLGFYGFLENFPSLMIDLRTQFKHIFSGNFK